MILFIFLAASLQSAPAKAPCANKKFDIVIGKNVSFGEILEYLAQECLLSVIYADKDSQKILEDKDIILNFYQTGWREILQTGFEALDLDYKIEGQKITISRLETKTFYIHYIATSRVASSNTNIIFSQDAQQDNTFAQNPTLNAQDSHQRLLDMASTQESNNNKSGSKIYSLDALDFWGDIQKDLYHIIFHENDKYFPSQNSQPIIIDRGSGFITITATPSQIKRAETYIQKLNSKLSAQVLIDVNIFTITHRDSKTTGIDWSKFYDIAINTTTSAFPSPMLSFSQSGSQYGINIFSSDVTIGQIVQFLNTYGTVNSTSNPKILTLNNQPALISVGNILRYTQNLVYQTANTSSTLQNTRQQYPSVFSGVLLDITPSIEGDEIILKINPSITATKDLKIENEPNALKSPPNLSTNQLSSIVRLKDNQRVILGGLISRSNTRQEKRLPILGYIPVIKYLFSYTKYSDDVQEMVIIITPKIIRLDSQPQEIYTPPLFPPYHEPSFFHQNPSNPAIPELPNP